MYLFIVNPSSGNGKAVLSWERIEKILKKKKCAYDVLIGGSEASAREFIRESREKQAIKAVGVVGGDGTVNAVLQDLVHTKTAIAFFPSGSGNDLARMFNLTGSPHTFVEKLLAGTWRELDVLKVNNSFGLTVSGVGLDAAIGARAGSAWYKKAFNKAGAGGLSYKLSALIEILRFKPFESTVKIDGEDYISGRTWMIACGNTTLYGGGLVICPYAHPMDGVADVTLVHSVKRSVLLFRLFPLLMKGRPVLQAGVTYKKGKQISIETAPPVPVMIEGENIGTTPVTLSVHEKAVRFILSSD